MLVRLKPHNVKLGHVLRSYTYQSQRFLEARGWYEVPNDMAEALAELVQQDTVPNSPKAFDVCTLEQAKAMEEAERLKAERATIQEPNVIRVHEVKKAGDTGRQTKTSSKERDNVGALTTADLPKLSADEAEEAEPEDVESEEEFTKEFVKPVEVTPKAPLPPRSGHGHKKGR